MNLVPNLITLFIIFAAMIIIIIWSHLKFKQGTHFYPLSSKPLILQNLSLLIMILSVFQHICTTKYFYKIIFKLIKLTFMESRLSNRSSESAFNIPQRQEWALIYQHRALELQRAKSMQKMLLQQKRDNFKKQLDSQLEQKHNKGAAQKEQDRRYYDYIMSKAQEMKQKEDKQKLDRYMNIKQLQQHNKQIIQTHTDPKSTDKDKSYYIQIGLKSQLQKRERAEAIKKDVIQTLDKQRLQKSMSREAQKEKQLLMKQRNDEYQASLFENRNKQNKKYQQNINVYNHYRNLYQEKMKKDKELERKFVDEVQQRKIEDENKKKQQEISEKQRRNLQMKDTLSRQVQLINHRKQQDKLNPEQVTYSFIRSIFREKKPTFDKQEYSLYLEKQAQEQRLNKIQQKYMSQQEYRLNANQLHKAINGSYTFDNYQDRSMVTLGDRINMNKVEPLQVPDAQIVKSKLNDARNNRRGRSLNSSSIDLSSPFF